MAFEGKRLSRRQVAQLVGGGRRSIVGTAAERAYLRRRARTFLVLGIDISDTITLDPARLAQYTSPMTVLCGLRFASSP